MSFTSTTGLTLVNQGGAPWSVTGTVAVTGPLAVTQGTSPWVVDGSAVTQPISATALPLPTNASTSANQASALTLLSSIDSRLTSPITITGTIAATQSGTWTAGRTWTLSNGIDSVNIGNLPSIQAVSQSGAWTVTSNAGTGTFLVDGSGHTQPVSGTFFQATQPVSIASMPVTPVTGTFFQATQPVSLAVAPTTPVTGTFWQAIQPISGTVTANAGSGTFLVDGSAHTQPVSGTVSAAQSGVWTVQPGNTANTTAWKVDGSAVTQPTSQPNATFTQSFTAISQTLNVDVSGYATAVIQIAGTWVGGFVFNVSADGVNFEGLENSVYANNNTVYESVPSTNGIFRASVSGYKTFQLITSAWTSGTANVTVVLGQSQSFIDAMGGEVFVGGSVRIKDGNDNPIDFGQALMAASLPVVIASNQTAVPISGTVTATVSGTVAATQSGTWNLNNVSGTISLPTGAATSLLQGTANTSLASIDSKLTSPLSVTGAFYPATQPVSGTFFQATQPISIADGSDITLGAKADAKSTATDGTAVTIMQVIKQISASVQAPPSQAVTNAGTFVTQATLAAETTKVIGTVNIAANQTVGLSAGSNAIGHVIVDTAPTTAVTGTFWQSTQPVSLASAPTTPVTGTFWQSTQPISATALPLPTNAATSALQTQPGVDIGDVTINNASGASAVNIQDGGNSITIDATSLPLPTGAATDTLQSAGNVLLANIDAGLPAALGAALIVASMPVNIASDQTVPVSAAALPLPTNAAQETGGNLALTSDVLQSILMELRSIRLAMTVMACSGGQANPEDFDPAYNNFDNKNFN